mgnify:CR=1 FL=1
MADRKNAFNAGASKFDKLKQPKKLADVSSEAIEAAGVKAGFTRDTVANIPSSKHVASKYRAPNKRVGEKRVSLALSKDDYKWLCMHAIDCERSLQSIVEELVLNYRKAQELE